MSTDQAIREAEEASKQLVEQWWVAYNNLDADHHRSLLGFPLASFGGARPGRNNLAVRFVARSEEWGDQGALYRDPNWHHSVILKQDARQSTPEKSHTLTEFTRHEADGKAYGLVKSRLSVGIKRDGKWSIRVLSSGGLRNPESPDEPNDQELQDKAQAVVEQVIDAINQRDATRLRSLCHFPFVRIPGTEPVNVERPEDLLLPSEADAVRAEISRIEALPPQAGDKVVVDVDIRRFDREGKELEPEGAICLVTFDGERWGLQFSSTRRGLSGLV